MNVSARADGCIVIGESGWPLSPTIRLRVSRQRRAASALAWAPLPPTDSTALSEDDRGASARLTFDAVDGTIAEAVFSAKPVDARAVDIRVDMRVLSGSGDVGLHQELSIDLGDDVSARTYLPGIWVDGNPHTAEGGPTHRDGDAWSFRDDRMAWPAAIAWLPDRAWSVALLRSTPAKRDCDYPVDRAGRIRGGISLDTDACDVGAMGFAPGGAGGHLRAHLPFAEVPKSYQDKRQLFPPVAGFYRARAGASWTIEYRLIAGPAADPYAAIEAAGRAGISLWGLSHEFRGDRSVSSLKRSMASRIAGHHFPARGSRGVAGFYTLVETFGDKPVVGICEPAFTGKAFFHAKNLIEYARETGDDRWSAMGASVFDSWLALEAGRGLIPDFWCRDLFGIPLDVPFAFDPPLVRPFSPNIATRRLAEAAQAVASASALPGAKTAWKDGARRLFDSLLRYRMPDGGYARWYRAEEGTPVQGDNPGALPSVVCAFVDAHRILGDDKYREAAEAAGRTMLETMVEPVRFHGSTLDADCEDKEAATATLAALRGLHDLTGDGIWLDAARKVAWMSAFWICLTDVPFAHGCLLADWKIRTKGLTLVSTENNHADVYLFSTPADLRWLSAKTGDAVFGDIGWTALLSSLQFVPTKANRLGPTRTREGSYEVAEGLVPELIGQTQWAYLNLPVVRKNRRWMKGYVDHKTSLWTLASIWDALSEMRAVAPEDEWNANLKP